MGQLTIEQLDEFTVDRKGHNRIAPEFPSLFDDVGAFHERFELDRFGDGKPPRLLDEEMMKFRVKFMQEELDEFILSTEEGNLHDAADALADLVYVALGTAHKMGLPFEEIWSEVHRANMTKVRSAGDADPRSVRKSRFDVVKPPDFMAPDHREALGRAAATCGGTREAAE